MLVPVSRTCSCFSFCGLHVSVCLTRAEEHLSCFQVWAIMKKAAMNIHTQVLHGINSHFSGVNVQSAINCTWAELYGEHMLPFLRN